MQRTLTLLFFIVCSSLSAQMTTESGPLYGNEWIETQRPYLRVMVAEDGIYRIDPTTLAAAGMSIGSNSDARFVLHHLGRQQPIEVTDEGIHFYGRRARGEFDAYLFEDAEAQQLNPRYGMYTDTAAYYLSMSEAGTQVRRYTEVAGNGGGSAIEVLFRSAEQVFGDHQSKFFRRTGGRSVLFSHYELAEGFGSRKSRDLLSSNGSTTTTAKLTLPGVIAGTARLDLRFGLAFGDHLQEISVGGQRLGEISASEWGVHTPAYSLTLGGQESDLSVKLEGRAGDRDKANLAYARLTYPAAVAFEGGQLSFSLPAGGSRTLTFAGLPTTARLFEVDGGGRVYGHRDGTFELAATDEERHYVLVGDYTTPAASATLTLPDLLPASEADYLLLSSRRLAGEGLDELVTYRQSAMGGGYRVHLVYVEDLYDAFGYGLNRHPQAIRNFLDAAMQRAPDLKYLFIVGKGREYNNLRTEEALARNRPTFFIPSFGLPSSDNLLTALPGAFTPRLATGRLPAINPSEVAIYARKLQEVERQVDQSSQTIEGVDWMKQVLFLGGGGQPSEQQTIRRNFALMEELFERSRFGANVTSVFRTSTDPIETTRQEIIFDRINTGTSIVNFYGHSSSQGFDFNIDNPENYLNKDKYMFMLSFGCYSGDAFTAERSIGERFTFLPQGGAVAYAASKGLGYLGALGSFGRSLYDHMGNDRYGQGVGDAIQAAVADFENTGNFYIGILLEQFSLTGDPAYRMHPRPGPDLIVDPASVRFIPGMVPAQDTAYEISLRLLNLGTYPDAIAGDSILLRFRQQLPSGEEVPLIEHRVPMPAYEQALSLRLPNLGYGAVGVNRILVAVDAADDIEELPAAAELNNDLKIGGTAGVPLTIIANSARAVFPPPYATVGGEDLTLTANTTNPLAEEREYLLQIDTAAAFGSLLVDEKITAPGGLIRYQPTVPLQDSTTYYWRISPDTSDAESELIWSASSFTYLRERETSSIGFAQQHPGQIANGRGDNLIVRPFRSDWRFSRNSNTVTLVNGLYVNRQMPRFEWNNTRYNSPHPWRIRAGIQVIVIDSINNATWYESGSGAYNSAPGKASPWSFDTRTDAGREGLMNFLEEGIEPGRYVILWSVQRGDNIEYHSEAWLQDSVRLGRNIYSVLENQGAEQARLLTSLGSVPYSFAYQKDVGKIGEAVAADIESTTSINIPLHENWPEGSYHSERFGPSLEWRSMSLRFLPDDIASEDSCILVLHGHSNSESTVELDRRPLAIRDRLSFDFDLSAYDAALYPHLSVSLEIYDPQDRTSPSLEHVYVDYLRPGDVAVNPDVALEIPDTLPQGEPALLAFGYENIARTDMDSMLVELTVIDENNEVTTLRQRRAPLPAGATDRVDFELPTEGQSGGFSFQFTLNPADDQPEDIRFNNVVVTDVGVAVDRVAPDMKVYYDGRRIRDGELISGRPEILVQLRDESSFRRLDDSSAYRLELTAPDGSSETIAASDQRLRFVPAPDQGENMAELYFNPELLLDGTYTLAVQSSDRSGNAAGRLDYQQSFEVINRSAISNVLTYPNPFTTRTSFVYTLTGSVAPEMFRVQIMTVSGRVVRDIDLLAHENISVGTHRTEYTWDGTDEYGDLLANGVYLYRVITSDGQEEMEGYDNGTDRFFRNGLGKVVILR